MSHEGIYLECTWTSIVDVVPGNVPPTYRCCQQGPHGKHRNHTYTQVKQWMPPMPKFAFALCCLRTWNLWQFFGFRTCLTWRSSCMASLGIIRIYTLPFVYILCAIRLFLTE